MILGNSISYWVFLSFSLFIFALFFPGSLNMIWGGEGTVLPVLLSFGISAMVADGLISGLMLGKHRYDIYNYNVLFQACGVLLSALALFAVVPSIELAIGFRVLALMIVAAWYAFLMVRGSEFSIKPPSVRVIFEQFRFGSKNYLQNIIGLANSRIFLYMLAVFHGPVFVGYLSVAQLFAEGMRLFPNAIGTVLFPKLASLNDQGEADALTAAVCRHTMAGTSAAALILVGVAPRLVIWFFGNEYAPAIPALRLMVFGAALNCLYQILTRYFTSQHLQRHSIKGGSLALIAGFCSAWVWIPQYGVVGAAAAYALSGAVAGLTLVHYFVRNSGLSAGRVLILDGSDFRQIVGFLSKRRV